MERFLLKLTVILAMFFTVASSVAMADGEIPIRKACDAPVIKPKTMSPLVVYYNSNLNALEICFRQYSGLLFYTVINMQSGSSIVGSFSGDSNNYIQLSDSHGSYSLILELENGDVYHGYFNT